MLLLVNTAQNPTGLDKNLLVPDTMASPFTMSVAALRRFGSADEDEELGPSAHTSDRAWKHNLIVHLQQSLRCPNAVLKILKAGGLGVAISCQGSAKKKFLSIDKATMFDNILLQTNNPLVLICSAVHPSEAEQPESQEDAIFDAVDVAAVPEEQLRSQKAREGVAPAGAGMPAAPRREVHVQPKSAAQKQLNDLKADPAFNKLSTQAVPLRLQAVPLQLQAVHLRLQNVHPRLHRLCTYGYRLCPYGYRLCTYSYRATTARARARRYSPC